MFDTACVTLNSSYYIPNSRFPLQYVYKTTREPRDGKKLFLLSYSDFWNEKITTGEKRGELLEVGFFAIPPLFRTPSKAYRSQQRITSSNMD